MKNRARWVVFGVVTVDGEQFLYQSTIYNTKLVKLTKDEAIEKFNVAMKETFGSGYIVAEVSATFYEESFEDE